MAPVLIYFPIITFINQIVIATIKVKIAAYQRKVIKVMMPLKKMAVNNNTSNSNIVQAILNQIIVTRIHIAKQNAAAFRSCVWLSL